MGKTCFSFCLHPNPKPANLSAQKKRKEITGKWTKQRELFDWALNFVIIIFNSGHLFSAVVQWRKVSENWKPSPSILYDFNSYSPPVSDLVSELPGRGAPVPSASGLQSDHVHDSPAADAAHPSQVSLHIQPEGPQQSLSRPAHGGHGVYAGESRSSMARSWGTRSLFKCCSCGIESLFMA